MDEPRSFAPAAGGNVEPLQRTAATSSPKHRSSPHRFELRDPFAEVTHRSRSFEEMTHIADRVGAIRFVAIDAEGKRTAVSKVSGGWSRPEPVLTSRGGHGVDPSSAGPVATPQRDEQSSKANTDAERTARVAALEAGLKERYLIRRAPIRIGDVTIGQTEYRHRGDTSRIAFTESSSRLSTETNSPSVARSMVDVAEARSWQALRVSGNEDFKRMVWLEASLRSVKTVGYEPVPADLDVLRKEREARQLNRIEPHTGPADPSSPTSKQSARGAGRKTVLAALEAVLVAQRVPSRQREAVMAAAAENLAQRQRNGESLRVKVYDRAAPVQRPPIVPPRVIHRAHERTGPTR